MFSGPEVTTGISDQGGGIAHDKLGMVWQYAYTTVDTNGSGPNSINAARSPFIVFSPG